MNKADLIEAVALKSDISKSETRTVIENMISVISDELSRGEMVRIVGFGIFHVTERTAREGIIPSSKKLIKIPSRKVAKFRAGQELKNFIN
jgi:DNA-binding protein HU-beta